MRKRGTNFTKGYNLQIFFSKNLAVPKNLRTFAA